jgi:hypothetical protein
MLRIPKCDRDIEIADGVDVEILADRIVIRPLPSTVYETLTGKPLKMSASGFYSLNVPALNPYITKKSAAFELAAQLAQASRTD